MSQTDKTSPAAAPQAAISEHRRRLLKAAAAGAPLIATLPSGAALANASASQCTIDNTTADPDFVVLNTDKFVRVPAWQVDFKKGNDTSTYWSVNGLDTAPSTGKDNLGAWFDANKKSPDQGSKAQGEPKRAYLLRVFALDDPDLPTGVEAVTTTRDYYPYAQPDADLTAMTGTCLCSVNPGALPTDFCA